MDSSPIEEVEIEELEALFQQEEASEFLQQQYLHGYNGSVPWPEDFYLTKDGYRSREL